MTKGFMTFFIGLAILPLFTGCAIVWRYAAYYGKVVDAETKEPLEGAVLLAVYYTESPGPAGAHAHYLDAQETVTDRNGEFEIPALTVKTFRVGHGFKPHAYFRIFKPGYGCYTDHKGVKPIFMPGGTLPAKQYVTIELPKLKTREERVRNTSRFPVSVPDEKMRKFIELNNIERVNLGLQSSHIQEEKK